jgi:hypothetical protein
MDSCFGLEGNENFQENTHFTIEGGAELAEVWSIRRSDPGSIHRDQVHKQAENLLLAQNRHNKIEAPRRYEAAKCEDKKCGGDQPEDH